VSGWGGWQHPLRARRRGRLQRHTLDGRGVSTHALPHNHSTLSPACDPAIERWGVGGGGACAGTTSPVIVGKRRRRCVMLVPGLPRPRLSDYCISCLLQVPPDTRGTLSAPNQPLWNAVSVSERSILLIMKHRHVCTHIEIDCPKLSMPDTSACTNTVPTVW
jgi:hypothetical protein